MFTGLLQHLLAFPTVLWTGPLAVLLGWWILVVLGASDLHVDGADADMHDDADLLDALGLGAMPSVVALSLLVIGGWATSLLLSTLVLSPAAGSVGLMGLSILLVSLVGAIGLARLGGSMLGPIFRHHATVHRTDLIGQECRVVSGRVDASFGQAELFLGGSALRVEVRCDRENTLRAGDPALVAYFDEARDAYVIENLSSAVRLGERPLIGATRQSATEV